MKFSGHFDSFTTGLRLDVQCLGPLIGIGKASPPQPSSIPVLSSIFQCLHFCYFGVGMTIAAAPMHECQHCVSHTPSSQPLINCCSCLALCQSCCHLHWWTQGVPMRRAGVFRVPPPLSYTTFTQSTRRSRHLQITHDSPEWSWHIMA